MLGIPSHALKIARRRSRRPARAELFPGRERDSGDRRFEDDRKEVTDESLHPKARERAGSVCAVIPFSRVEERRDAKWVLSAPTMADFYDVDSSEPFRHQPVAAVGTAFLVKRDVVATALHVATRVTSAQELCFVFGYEVRNGHTRTVFDPGDVYLGAEILWGHRGADIALVRLDRQAKDRPTVPLRLRSRIQDEEDVYVIGFPAGLPAKFADHARVTENPPGGRFFSANLDVMLCNSGSPIFSGRRHDVVGIVSRGPIGFTSRDEKLVSFFDQDEDDAVISRITNLLSSSCFR